MLNGRALSDRVLLLRAGPSHAGVASIALSPVCCALPAHLIELILDILRASPAIPLQLPHPLDPRALKVADYLHADPGSGVSTEEICTRIGACKRTIERLFRQDTRMTLGMWRQQLRLIHSMRLMAQGMKINSVALEVGYRSPSAFILMFRSILGTTPGQYFQ
jgi:transcriptional regulator GlxA family with amidase domain